MDYKQIIEKGLSLGISEIEVFASTSESNNLRLFNGNIETYNLNKLLSVSIRGLYNGKMGYVSTEVVDEASVETLLHTLIENSKVVTSPEKEFIFEGGSVYPKVKEARADYEQHSFDEKVALLKELEARAKASDARIVRVAYCQYVETANKTYIINSKGVDLCREYSYLLAVLGVLAAEGTETAVGYAADVNTKFAEIEKDRILKEAVETALSKLNAGSIETGEYDIVFDRDVATEILGAFSSVFSGESAVKKMSILTDKVGQKVFGDNITIVDDPAYPDSIMHMSFDDEGVPAFRKDVVKDGVFEGFLHSLKTANFFGVKPTGNGFKRGGAVSPSPTNLVLVPGTKTKDEIVASMEKGVFINSVAGLHAGLNPISGSFNVQASGFYVENGVKVRPITLFVVSGNFFEMMNDVKEIGCDIEPRFSGIASPTLRVGKLKISGK